MPTPPLAWLAPEAEEPLLGPAGAYSVTPHARWHHDPAASPFPARLRHEERAVATLHDGAGGPVLTFDQAEGRAHFETHIGALRLPDWCEGRPERVAADLLLSFFAEQDRGSLYTRDAHGQPGQWPDLSATLADQDRAGAAEAQLALLGKAGVRQVYRRGAGWCDLLVSDRLYSDQPPVALADAVQLALATGDPAADLFGSAQAALTALSELSRHLLGTPYRGWYDHEDRLAALVGDLHRHVQVCLAGLGRLLPGGAHEPLSPAGRAVLGPLSEALYPGVPATLAHLAEPNPNRSVHSDLLDGLLACEASSEIELGDLDGLDQTARQGAQRTLLSAAVGLMRVARLTGETDVNAVLGRLLRA